MPSWSQMLARHVLISWHARFQALTVGQFMKNYPNGKGWGTPAKQKQLAKAVQGLYLHFLRDDEYLWHGHEICLGGHCRCSDGYNHPSGPFRMFDELMCLHNVIEREPLGDIKTPPTRLKCLIDGA